MQDGRPVCSCKVGYLGAPPNCRPECVVQSECPLDKACFNQKCVDPCPGTCGYGARCRVVNHNPICSCPSGFTGDPFTSCVEEISKLVFPVLARSFKILFDLAKTWCWSIALNVACMHCFFRTTCSRRDRKSMSSFTLWTVFRVPRCRFQTSMYLFTDLYRSTAKL